MKCRHCSAELATSFLDLGTSPPSNAYLRRDQLAAPETWFPLRIMACASCWLVQTEDYASREILFSNDYAYFSSFSSSWLAQCRDYAATMVHRYGLTGASLVCEVAANDGYLLQYFKSSGIPCYGVEPTASTAAAARAKGIEIVEEFFGVALATRLRDQGRSADLMAANNVVAHVPDVGDFLKGFAILLKPSGVATFEFPHLLRMVEHAQFDTAYHEHYSYWSLTAAVRVFAANGLTIFDADELPSHGGSLRVHAQRSDTGTRSPSDTLHAVLAAEHRAGVETPAFYAGFQTRAEGIKDAFVAFLIEAKKTGLKVGAYGAAAKGNTLLNFAGIKSDLLPWVVDANPVKQGMFLPGSRIPIVAEERLRAEKPDRIVLLPWNLKDELMQKLAYAREWNAKFVIAVPSLLILD